MYSEDAFLKAIQANPDDDTPRLVYSDWLEEHGEAPRAELIRLQCADADLPRQRELLAAHGACWAGEQFAHVYSYSFRRGFVEDVTIEGRMFLTVGPQLFDAAPVRLMRVIGARSMLDDLVHMPELKRLRALHLTGCKIGDEGASLLARCPHLEQLRTLRLGNNALSDQAVEELVNSPLMGSLGTLTLCDNMITDLGASLLSDEKSMLRNLRSLDLSENLIGEVGAEALAKSSQLRLERLVVSNQFKGWSSGFALRGRPNPIQPPQRNALVHRFGAAVCVF